MNLSFQKIFFAIATIFALFAFMVLARTILIPLTFAVLISFILLPLARKFEVLGVSRIFASLFSILLVYMIIGGGVFLISSQILELSKEFSQFQDRIIRVFADVTSFINGNFNFVPHLEKGELFDQLKSWVKESSGSLAKQTFNSTASILTGLLATTIFTFLLLIYRHGYKQAFIRFFPEDKKERAGMMLRSVQQVGQKYLVGVILIVITLGVINSVGLLIIGIDNPFLFGFLAAVLAIIPYVGTVTGAAIPVLYAFMAYDSIWMAVAVAILFWFVQVVESNFLSPKIVGGSLKVNALAAILSIIAGASVWGIAGMILFLPLTAMLKVVCEQYEELKPIALLIGEQNTKKDQNGVKLIKNRLYKIRDWASKNISSHQ